MLEKSRGQHGEMVQREEGMGRYGRWVCRDRGVGLQGAEQSKGVRGGLEKEVQGMSEVLREGGRAEGRRRRPAWR